MSGGSYDYLAYKSVSDLIDRDGELRSMADRLAGLGYARDAARETEDLILTLRQFQNRIQTRIDRLSGVWHAVEWWDSGDSGEDYVKEELAKYRGE